MSKTALWEKYSKNKDIDTKNKLIEEYAYMLKIVASRLYNYYGGKVEFDDLMGYGALGLIDAIDKFDIDRDIKFETYAQVRIRGAIIDNLRRMDWVPRTLRSKAKKIENMIYQLENELDREVTNKDVAEKLEISQQEVENTIKEIASFNIASIDEIILNTGEILSNNSENPQDIIDNRELSKILTNAIQELPEKEKMVISLYYNEELTYKEIGEIIQLSESRISQIHSKAIKTIKNKLDNLDI